VENMEREPKTLQEAIVHFSDPDRCFKFLMVRRFSEGAYCPQCGAKDVRFILGDSECRAMLIDSDFVDTLDGAVAEGAPRPPVVVVCGGGAPAAPAIGLDAFLRNQPDRLDSAPMSPDDMAFWIYTSGTTGTPKAAVHCHHDVLPGDLYLG